MLTRGPDPGPQCFKYITIQANGVTVGGVQIMGASLRICAQRIWLTRYRRVPYVRLGIA